MSLEGVTEASVAVATHGGDLDIGKVKADAAALATAGGNIQGSLTAGGAHARRGVPSHTYPQSRMLAVCKLLVYIQLELTLVWADTFRFLHRYFLFSSQISSLFCTDAALGCRMLRQ